MNFQSSQRLHEQAVNALNNNEIEKAHSYLVQLIKDIPTHADAYFLLAMVNVKVGQIVKAAKLIEKAICFKDNTEYRAQLAKCYALMGELSKVRTSVERVKAQEINEPLTADTIGVALSRVGLHDRAITFFEQAIELDNQNASYLYNYGVSCKFTGKFAQAVTAFEQAITIEPMHVAAHYSLTDVSEIDINNNHIERLLTAKQNINNVDEQLYIGHALAREYEAIKHYDQAFESLLFAKKAKHKQLGYTFSRDQDMFNVLTEQVCSNQFDEKKGFTDNSAIFIVGMPRTGTTVVERMLTQNPEVQSAGELHDFAMLTKQLSQDNSPFILSDNILKQTEQIDFEKLGQAYIHKAKSVTNCQGKFVDKMPLNVLYSQLILTALPNAKIICLDRNPLDTIMSNFRQLFATNFSFYHYSLSLTDIYRFYINFKQLADLYARQYPDNFMLVNYETLVNSPDQIGDEISKFCGVNWHSKYALIEENTNSVDTASAVQVRQPIVNSNIGNWQHYQKYLQEIIDCMNDDGFESD